MYIAFHGQGPAAKRLNLSYSVFRVRARIPISDGHMRTCARQRQGDLPTNAASATSHQRGFSSKRKFRHTQPFCLCQYTGCPRSRFSDLEYSAARINLTGTSMVVQVEKLKGLLYENPEAYNPDHLWMNAFSI